MIQRNTIQIGLVLKAVNELKCHASADEVYNRINKEYPNISRATVYRDLNQLADSGKILRVEIPNGSARYDHQTYKHYHVVCQKCNRVFDVDMDEIMDLQSKIKEKHGFQFNDYDIVFKGICPECK